MEPQRATQYREQPIPSDIANLQDSIGERPRQRDTGTAAGSMAAPVENAVSRLFLPAGKDYPCPEDKWMEGIFAGIVYCSDEVYIMMSSGTVKARSVRRLGLHCEGTRRFWRVFAAPRGVHDWRSCAGGGPADIAAGGRRGSSTSGPSPHGEAAATIHNL